MAEEEHLESLINRPSNRVVITSYSYNTARLGEGIWPEILDQFADTFGQS